MKKVIKLFLALLFTFSIAFSSALTVKADGNIVPPSTNDPAMLVSGITLDKKDAVLEVGSTLQLNASILPENASNKQIKWTTSNADTASVDANGLVTALQQGSAVITATTVDGSKTASCTVTVNAAKGWVKVNGKWYYYDAATGIKKTGWLNYNGVWYYLMPNGEMKTGWQMDKGYWYYLNPNGAMVKGWLLYNGQWYYLNSSGDMAVDWIYKNGKWYYLYSSGAMATGWIQSNGTWYCLYKNGEMAAKAGLQAAVNSSGVSSATQYFITIDSTNQMVNIYTGYTNHWTLIRSMRCASGRAETPTVKGLYSIYGRGPQFRAASNTICKYFTGFYGNYLFHTVLLDNNGNIQDPTLGVPASHGCVRLAIEDAEYIYYNMPNGTRVWSY
ncbi:MAG: N-acetylmuramoyl-L-alanine amidase [Clostridiaceae bacterium]|jgi:hypothetical protein|nr:N-acetylmuramoyl-L-alanine amidase [Clostridiaceae bacterium]